MITKEEISEYFKSLQDHICVQIAETDGGADFSEDNWQHESGGGGRSRIIKKGNIIEKGGVNFSAVKGKLSEALQKQLNVQEPLDFYATGVSIVMHPQNPFVPIIHMNIRYFELSNGACWFGGGIDLTPHYIDDTQAQWFHNQLKNACSKHSDLFYTHFKPWADDYFYIPHRKETRGIGGIFYDYLRPDLPIQKTGEILTKAQIFDFTKTIGETFAPTYTQLMNENHKKSFTSEQKSFQLLRRGRYVEFNLVWDKGTKFGLETNGRTESILMSLPPFASWDYNPSFAPNSEEQKTLSKLVKGTNWA
jgi:coproporphyrinogen III oxidase